MSLQDKKCNRLIDPDVMIGLTFAFSLIVISLLYMAYPDGAWHNITFLLRPRPAPRRGVGTCIWHLHAHALF